MSLSHVPGRQDELGVNVLVHGPTDKATAVEVHNAGQIEPAFVGANVGNVADPDLVGSSGGGQLGQAIRSNRLVMVAIGGADLEAAFGTARRCSWRVKRAMRLRP